MPQELMIQKYKEIIKTKDELERKSLVSADALLKGLKTSSTEDDNYDFSPSIPKRTKHQSLMKKTLKKKMQNGDNLLEVSNENPFLSYDVTQSENFSSDTNSNVKNENTLIESISIPLSNPSLVHYKTMEEPMSVSLNSELDEKETKKEEHESLIRITNQDDKKDQLQNENEAELKKEPDRISVGCKKPFSHFKKSEENSNSTKDDLKEKQEVQEKEDEIKKNDESEGNPVKQKENLGRFNFIKEKRNFVF